MYFMEDRTLREIERMMCGIPNFAPRGRGLVILCEHSYTDKDCDCSVCLYHTGGNRHIGCRLSKCVCLPERITAGCATMRDALTETMSAVRSQPFWNRLKQYIEESEKEPMPYRNEKHRMVFEEAAAVHSRKDYALLAALYLLTADKELWRASKSKVTSGAIHFDKIRLPGCEPNVYTLFSAAKDLYLGTENLTLGDLADTVLIPTWLFAVICSAMAVRRFGLGAVESMKRGVL